MYNVELMALVRETFKGRQDVVPKKLTNGGYSPICNNFGDKSLCLKMQQGNCKDCKNTNYQALTDTLLADHLAGKCLLGVYPLLQDGTCHFIAGDFDNHDGKRDPISDIKALQEVCDAQDIKCYVFRSQSGKGFHVYLFFTDAVPAWKARLVYHALIEEAQIIGDETNNSSFDRMFPNQDELSNSTPLGNLIAMPFQGKAVGNGNTIIMDPASGFEKPYADQFSILNSIERVSGNQLDALIDEWDLDKKIPPVTAETRITIDMTEQINRLCKCDFLKWAFTNQENVSETLWWPMISNLSTIRPNGNDLCHRFSSEHPKYSRRETDNKIKNALDGPPPHTCDFIKKNGFDCGKECGVKTPVVLYNRLNKPEVQASSTANSTLSVDIIPVNVKKVLPNAPVPSAVTVPPGWEISQNGIARVKSSKGNTEPIIPVPVVIKQRFTNIVNKQEELSIAWFKGGVWKDVIVPRIDIVTTREITKLAQWGFPITSLTAKDVVAYFFDFENANIKTLPVARTSSHLGWQKKEGFLLGNTFYAAGDDQTKKIIFRGDDDGNNQIADGYCSLGSYDKWIDLVNDLHTYPFSVIFVYFSLLPPFLQICDGPNHIVDLSNNTSTGKTTTMRLAGSCWGNPDERSPSSVISTWDTTEVGVERTAQMLNGLPLILDDTKLAGTGKNKNKAAELISHVLYLVANGKARMRGSLEGIRDRGSWRTVLLSTGEQPAIDFTNDGGSRARVISLWAAPFGKANNRTSVLVNRINTTVTRNYGFAGHELISYIMLNQDQWESWRLIYHKNREIYAQKAGNDSVAIRISDYFALLATAIPLIREALPGLRVDISVEDIIAPIWNVAITEAEETDMAVKALRHIYEWAVSNQTSFWGRHQSYDNGVRVPNGGWAGKWEQDDWKFIAFIPKEFKTIMDEAGFDYKGIINTFRDRNWLETDKSGKGKQLRIGPSATSTSVYCYCLKHDVLVKQLGLEADVIKSGPKSIGVIPFTKAPAEKPAQDIAESQEESVIDML